MKKLVWLILAAMIVLVSVSAMAEGKLEVTEFTQFQLDKGDGRFTNFVYAGITNTGDAACRVDVVYVQHTDGNGNVYQEKKCSNVYPSSLEPGETGYLFSSESFKEIQDPSVISQIVLVPVATDRSLKKNVYLESEVDVKTTERETDFSVLIDETVTNPTTDRSVSPYVCFRIYDQNDELIYTTGIYFGNVIALPNSPVAFRVGGNWETSRCWKQEGRIPTKIVPFTYITK